MTRKQLDRYLRTRRLGSRSSIGRRQFLGRAGLMAGGVALAPSVLAACSSSSDDKKTGSGSSSEKKLDVANWPLYIDDESVADFEKQTGIKTSYKESINDNNEYFATIQEPLSQGDGIGADVIAPTSWLAARLFELEYVQEIDFDKVPNISNLRPDLKNPSWDPDGVYSLPWQTGITGIAYNLSQTGRDLSSVNDLFDPAFKGKVGMLLELRDTVGLTLLGEGLDPTAITYEETQPAFDKLQEAADSGQIRSFTGNDYQDDLVNGNFAVNIAWSGDVAQLALDDPNIKFIIPDEGGMSWADTMVMPTPSDRMDSVTAWMNYFYDPVNAARVTASVQYISPVDGVQEQLRNSTDEATKALAESVLVFPDDEVLAGLSVFQNLDEDQEELFDTRFAEITGGG